MAGMALAAIIAVMIAATVSISTKRLILRSPPSLALSLLQAGASSTRLTVRGRRQEVIDQRNEPSIDHSVDCEVMLCYKLKRLRASKGRVSYPRAAEKGSPGKPSFRQWGVSD